MAGGFTIDENKIINLKILLIKNFENTKTYYKKI